MAEGDDLLEDLNDAQRRAVTSPSQPLCILAGAGSGKTRVLTRRIAWRAVTGSADPRRVLALTFTRKAAGELVRRLHTLGLRDSVAAGTFHSVAYAQLRQRWDEQQVTAPSLLDRKAGFVADVLRRHDLRPRPLPGRRPPSKDTVLFDSIGEIEWAQARRIRPEHYPERAAEAKRQPVLGADAMAEIYAGYRKAKRERNVVDFDDLLARALRELERDDAWAAAQRWRFQHLFVDEYQDVNPLQHALLQAWVGDRTDLCVVGDPNQAIYAWNGADARYLEAMAAGEGGGEVIRLVDNYRSSPQILGAANRVLAAGRRGRHTELRAHRPDGPPPSVTAHADEGAEATAVARAVRDARLPGAPWSAQAVLVRTNAQTALIADALRRVGIPARVRGGAGLLDLPVVKSALRDLRRFEGSFADAVADLAAAARAEPADATGESAAEGAAGLDALVELAHRFAALDASPSVPGFLTWLADAAADDDPTGARDAVEVATFHAAKGLEWPVVHLAGMEAGLVPISRATTIGAKDEEQRLLYVAVTRAERELHCTWAERRTFGERVTERSPSPYLEQLAAPAGPTEGAAEARRRRPRRTAAAAAAERPPTAPGDAGLLADLKAWRLAKSKAAAVPAFVVFNDRTLQAIAASRPTTRGELLDIAGIGEVKANRFGDEVLEVVARHREASVG